MREEFKKYLHLLQKWNKTYNLTSILDENEILIKHFEDSLAPLSFWPQVQTVLDIGCGAGFPGIPLKIKSPLLKITLCDSNRKKIDFCNAVIRELRLQDIETIHERVADSKVLTQMGTFDLVISRATFKISEFLKISRPYLRPGGIAMAMKGPDWRNDPGVENLPSPLFQLHYRLRDNYGERVLLAFQRGSEQF